MKMLKPRWSQFVLLHILLASCFSIDAWAQFVRPNFSGRRHLSTAAIDDFLYIHGGEPANISDTRWYESLVIHLKDAWPADSPTIAPMNWASTAVQMLGHRVWAFQLWKIPGSRSLLSWAGVRTANSTTGSFVPDAPLTRDLFLLATDGRGVANWAPERPADPAAAVNFTAATKASDWGPGWGYSVSCAGFGLQLGGVAAAGSGSAAPFGGGWYNSSKFVSGLVTYEMATKKWARESVPSSAFAGAAAGGSAVCIPNLGERGLVLFLGGYVAPDGTEIGAVRAGSGGGALSLDNLVFYDPAKKSWLSQTATGDVPSNRSSFCAVGVKNAGQGYNSSEIYLFGGDESLGNGKPTGSLYVLSLPAMNWWRVLQGELGSSGHACEVVGNRQMVVLGGQGDARQNPMGLRVFDMGKMDFVANYSASQNAYESPSFIRTWYSLGNLGQVRWRDDDVKGVMLGTGGSKGGASSGAGGNTQGSGSNIGAIVGGVVGGVVALALIGLAAWFLIQRRRRRTQTAAYAPAAVNESETAHKEGSGATDGPYGKPELDASPTVTRSELASTHLRSPELDSAAVSSLSPMEGTVVSASELDAGLRHELPGNHTWAELPEAEIRRRQ